jgi:hypothetical protein
MQFVELSSLPKALAKFHHDSTSISMAMGQTHLGSSPLYNALREAETHRDF